MINKRNLIAYKIKKARKEIEITQKELGNILFQDQTVISKIENGKLSVPSEKLIDFSKALKKPVTYFLSDF